jgi:hypothetical protein
MIDTEDVKTPKWKGTPDMQAAAKGALEDMKKMYADGVAAEDLFRFHSNRFTTCGHVNLGRIYNAFANAEN